MQPQRHHNGWPQLSPSTEAEEQGQGHKGGSSRPRSRTRPGTHSVSERARQKRWKRWLCECALQPPDDRSWPPLCPGSASLDLGAGSVGPVARHIDRATAGYSTRQSTRSRTPRKYSCIWIRNCCCRRGRSHSLEDVHKSQERMMLGEPKAGYRQRGCGTETGCAQRQWEKSMKKGGASIIIAGGE